MVAGSRDDCQYLWSMNNQKKSRSVHLKPRVDRLVCPGPVHVAVRVGTSADRFADNPFSCVITCSEPSYQRHRCECLQDPRTGRRRSPEQACKVVLALCMYTRYIHLANCRHHPKKTGMYLLSTCQSPLGPYLPMQG